MQFLLNIFNNAFSRYLILRVSLCQGTAEDPGRSRGNALAMPALKSSSKWHRTPSVLAFGRSWCCPCWKWSRDAAELPALTQGEAEKGGCRRKGPSQMHPWSNGAVLARQQKKQTVSCPSIVSLLVPSLAVKIEHLLTSPQLSPVLATKGSVKASVLLHYTVAGNAICSIHSCFASIKTKSKQLWPSPGGVGSGTPPALHWAISLSQQLGDTAQRNMERSCNVVGKHISLNSPACFYWIEALC